MTPLETRLRSLREAAPSVPAPSVPSPAELRRRSAARRNRRRLFTVAALAVPFIVVALAVFVAADPGGGGDDRATTGQDDPSRTGTGESAASGGDGRSNDDSRLFEVARLASAAAHEIQIEGELAVLFSATKTDADRTAWEAQAAPTDQAVEEVAKAVETIDVGKLDVRTRSALALVGEKVSAPRAGREIVGGGETEWPATLNLYQAISDAYVEATLRAANSTSDPEVNAEARTWSIAVQIESEIAYQRALVTGVLATGSFLVPGDEGNNSTFENIEQADADEASYARTLEDFGEEAIRDIMRDALSGREVSAADDLVQQVMSDRNATAFEIDVELWRTTSGTKLDRVHTAQVGVAESVAESIPAVADQGSGKAEAPGSTDRDRRPLVAGGGVLLGVALAAAFLAGRRLATGDREHRIEG